MKVKIISAASKNLWYSNKIGEIFNVKSASGDGEWDFDYVTLDGYNGILKEDCEVVEEEKHQFQIGDEVIYCNANWFIENIDLQDRYYLISPGGSVHLCSIDHKNIKPIVKIVEKEKEMFDLKKEKWFIRTPTPEISKAVQEWLFEQGIEWSAWGKKVVNTDEKYLTNIQYSFGDETFVGDHILYSIDSVKNAKEIKFTFKTVVDGVEYPEVKSEAQVELEKLQEQIKQLQEQADIVKSKL